MLLLSLVKTMTVVTTRDQVGVLPEQIPHYDLCCRL